MAKEEDTGKTPAELEAHVWKLARKIQFALFTSWDGKRIVQWPLTANVDADARRIEFLIEDDGKRYRHLGRASTVTLGFADHPKYVVIRGEASLSNDRERIRELWSPFAKAWWDSPEDPLIRVLTVEPTEAEYWDSGSSIVSSVLMLTAAATGAKPAIGEHAKVGM